MMCAIWREKQLSEVPECYGKEYYVCTKLFCRFEFGCVEKYGRRLYVDEAEPK